MTHEHACPYCGQDIPRGPNHSPKEAAARRLQRVTAGSLPFCRRSILALLEKDWNIGKINKAIELFAEPGMAPWDWCKAATHKPFRAEPETVAFKAMSHQELADLAGEPLGFWLEKHKINTEAD